jgi:hypothetical protein
MVISIVIGRAGSPKPCSANMARHRTCRDRLAVRKAARVTGWRWWLGSARVRRTRPFPEADHHDAASVVANFSD